MFAKTIAALKAAEAAMQTELAALFVPYDPTTGGGGVYWHAAGSGILQNALQALAALRADLEKRMPPKSPAEQRLEKANTALAGAQASKAQADAAEVAAADAAKAPQTDQIAVAQTEVTAAQAAVDAEHKAAVAAAQAKLDEATKARDEAKADPTTGPDAMATAEQAVVDAQAELDELNETPEQDAAEDVAENPAGSGLFGQYTAPEVTTSA